MGNLPLPWEAHFKPWATSQPLLPGPVPLHGVIGTHTQHLALALVGCLEVRLGPSTQPVRIPLQSLPALKEFDCATYLGVTCELSEGALHPLLLITAKIVEQNWPQE